MRHKNVPVRILNIRVINLISVVAFFFRCGWATHKYELLVEQKGYYTEATV